MFCACNTFCGVIFFFNFGDFYELECGIIFCSVVVTFFPF